MESSSHYRLDSALIGIASVIFELGILHQSPCEDLHLDLAPTTNAHYFPQTDGASHFVSLDFCVEVIRH